MYLEAFTTHFSQIEDQRQSAKVTYPLFDILFVTLCSVIAGAEGWEDIRDYAECHHDWFKNEVCYQMEFLLMTRLPAPFHE